MPQLDKLFADLYRRARQGIRPGLEAEWALLELLGRPEKNLTFIHIAGTNGKGSVGAMLESVLRAAGLSTGFYTSPHLLRFHERIRCNGASIADAELAEVLDEVFAAERRLMTADGQLAPTFFEIATAAAFCYFRRRKPQVIVLETGMGGRWDATNVVTPLAAVITGISLEHTEYLGGTVAEIAREKAGIIKPGRPVFIGRMPAEARAVICETARARQTPLIEAETAVRVMRRAHDLTGQRIRVESAGGLAFNAKLPLLGAHQLGNAALAVAVLEHLFGERVAAAVKQGLETVWWPGRLQVLESAPLILLDVAHNPEGAAVCVRALRELLPEQKPLGLMVGLCRDKDLTGFLSAFGNLPRRCWAVPLRNPRSQVPETIAAAAAARGWRVAASDSALRALAEARQWAKAEDAVLCIAGSLFLAAEILEEYYPDKELFARKDKEGCEAELV